MDDLRSELNDLKQFIVELKADRAATKEKERREAWTRYVSLTVVIFAVIASIAAQWGGKYSSMTQMSQAQASDQWNFYEGQSVKQHIFEVTRAQLSKDANNAEIAKAQKDFDAQIAKYEARKVEIKKEAERLESRRDIASQIGGKLGLALSCFSVSIATASLCLLTKRKPLWFCSMIFAAFGIAQMIAAKTIKIP
jgi:Domain of unknown function (DUF4337)